MVTTRQKMPRALLANKMAGPFGPAKVLLGYRTIILQRESLS